MDTNELYAAIEGIAKALLREESSARAVAVLDREAVVVAQAGDIGSVDLASYAGLITSGLRGEQMADHLLAGKLVRGELPGRSEDAVYIGIAARCFFVVMLAEARISVPVASRLWQTVKDIEQEVKRWAGQSKGAPLRRIAPPSGGSAPSEDRLEVVEAGVTPGVPRPGPKMAC